MDTAIGTLAPPASVLPDDRVHILKQLERKLLWLSAWMIHNANHIRPNRDGLKVGGHQASCASVISIMTALYFEIARPQDRIAVKPHAGPVFHAMNYLFGRQSIDKMAALRAFGGAQPYPSRVKDGPEVDFSTGSVGLGVAMTTFSALMADYVRLHGLSAAPTCRPAATSPSPATPNSTRATSTRPCWKAGSTTSATSGGSSTTTARASTSSSPTGCSAASRACSATWAGTASRSNTAASWRPPSPATAARRCAAGSTTAPTRSTRR